MPKEKGEMRKIRWWTALLLNHWKDYCWAALVIWALGYDDDGEPHPYWRVFDGVSFRIRSADCKDLIEQTGQGWCGKCQRIKKALP